MTAGARYSHDAKERAGGTVLQEAFAFNPATDLIFLNYARTSSSKITWRAGLEWDYAPGSMFYGSVSTGYKAGGFNDGCAAGSVYAGQVCNQVRPPSSLYYQPETLTAYEIGDKSRLLANRLQINAGAFYYAYRNLQLSSVANFNGAPTQTTLNAGVSEVKGLEFEAVFLPDRMNRFDLKATFLDATYTCP